MGWRLHGLTSVFDIFLIWSDHCSSKVGCNQKATYPLAGRQFHQWVLLLSSSAPISLKSKSPLAAPSESLESEKIKSFFIFQIKVSHTWVNASKISVRWVSRRKKSEKNWNFDKNHDFIDFTPRAMIIWLIKDQNGRICYF